MLVAIDSGNTTSKIGIFERGKLVKISEKQGYNDLINEVKSLHPHQIILSTVNFSAEKIIKDLSPLPVFQITHETPLPVKLLYSTPHSLGIDRIALAAGAWEICPDSNILIIDAGTCITYDYINRDGNYIGGGISPGINMRFEALHKFTSNLPRVTFDESFSLTGTSTVDSIKSGVINGTIEEISGIINRYSGINEDLKVFFSGGFAKFFESKIKDRIFAFPNLVLMGLHTIYVYNNR